MAQAANRGSDVGKSTADKAVDLTSQAADAGKASADRMADAGRVAMDRSFGAASRFVAGSSRATKGMLNAEGDLFQLWLETASEQVRHQAHTFQRLMSARDWKEFADIQSSFVQASLSRLASLVSAQLEVGSAMASQMFSLGQPELRRTR